MSQRQGLGGGADDSECWACTVMRSRTLRVWMYSARVSQGPQQEALLSRLRSINFSSWTLPPPPLPSGPKPPSCTPPPYKKHLACPPAAGGRSESCCPHKSVLRFIPIHHLPEVSVSHGRPPHPHTSSFFFIIICRAPSTRTHVSEVQEGLQGFFFSFFCIWSHSALQKGQTSLSDSRVHFPHSARTAAVTPPPRSFSSQSLTPPTGWRTHFLSLRRRYDKSMDVNQLPFGHPVEPVGSLHALILFWFLFFLFFCCGLCCSWGEGVGGATAEPINRLSRQVPAASALNRAVRKVPSVAVCLSVCLSCYYGEASMWSVLMWRLHVPCVHSATRGGAGHSRSPPPSPLKDHVCFLCAISSLRMLYIRFVAVNYFYKLGVNVFFFNCIFKKQKKKKKLPPLFCIVPNTTWFLPPNVWVFTFFKTFFFFFALSWSQGWLSNVLRFLVCRCFILPFPGPLCGAYVDWTDVTGRVSGRVGLLGCKAFVPGTHYSSHSENTTTSTC